MEVGVELRQVISIFPNDRGRRKLGCGVDLVVGIATIHGVEGRDSKGGRQGIVVGEFCHRYEF